MLTAAAARRVTFARRAVFPFRMSTDAHVALLLAQVMGIPCSFLFGRVAGWMGTKPAIFLTLGCYTGISVLGYFMSTAAHFYALALLVGTVQGGSQALSRSLFATMVPRYKSSEFFGFFGVSEKFAGIIGPLVFAGVVALSGSSRGAVLSVIIFFGSSRITVGLFPHSESTDEERRPRS
jgi:UMF1 family MFS transporter